MGVIRKCKYCPRLISGPPHQIACSRPECKQALYREWKRKKYGLLSTDLPRTCIHCKEEYTLKDRKSNRRRFCYKPQCVEKNKSYAYRQARKRMEEWRKKPKATGDICQLCKKPLPSDGSRLFRHDACVNSCNERTDGDYLFCVDGETIF